jgi:hypothetical protein
VTPQLPSSDADVTAVLPAAKPDPATPAASKPKSATSPAPAPLPGGPVARHAARDGVLWALLGYALARAMGIAVIYFWGHAHGRSLSSQLGDKWDAVWYIGIATGGYDGGFNASRPNHLTSNMAFFPLFPGMIKALAAATPLNAQQAGIVIAGLAGLAAAWGMYAIGKWLHGGAAGIVLAVLWGVLPYALTESMAFSESLFTALAVWSLYATLTRRWVLAGALCLLAGLTRPSAVALIPVVIISALIAVIRRQDRWRPWIGGLLAPLGWLGYMAWVSHTLHRLDGYFYLQRAGWNTYFDFGAGTYRIMTQRLSHESPFAFYLVTAVLLLYVALFVISLIDRQPWQLLVYSGVLLLIALADATYYQSRARFMVPAFTLLIPIAVALARTKPARAVTVLITLAIASAYIGGYLDEIWKYSF